MGVKLEVLKLYLLCHTNESIECKYFYSVQLAACLKHNVKELFFWQNLLAKFVGKMYL